MAEQLFDDIFDRKDTTLESMVFLILDPPNAAQRIEGWRVGVGNVRTIRRTDESTDRDETVLLETLRDDHLDPVRDNDMRPTLVTPYDATLPRLRHRYLVNGVETTFRGFSHYCLEALLAEYFNVVAPSSEGDEQTWEWLPVSPASSNTTDVVDSLRRSANEIGPKVPAKAIQSEL